MFYNQNIYHSLLLFMNLLLPSKVAHVAINQCLALINVGVNIDHRSNQIKIKRWPELLPKPGRHPARSFLPPPAAPATLFPSAHHTPASPGQNQSRPFFSHWESTGSWSNLSLSALQMRNEDKNMTGASFWQLWQIFRETLTMENTCSKLDPLLPGLAATVHFSCRRL